MKSRRRRPHEDVTNQNMINRKRHGLWHSFIVNAQLSHLKSRGNDNNYSCRRAEYKVRRGRASMTCLFAIRYRRRAGPSLVSAPLRSFSFPPTLYGKPVCVSFFLCFHIHITMRGEASWQTSITFTHTRTHAKKRTRANTLANKRFVTSAYKSIMNHRHVIFVAFGDPRRETY